MYNLRPNNDIGRINLLSLEMLFLQILHFGRDSIELKGEIRIKEGTMVISMVITTICLSVICYNREGIINRYAMSDIPGVETVAL